jgi:putative transposase
MGIFAAMGKRSSQLKFAGIGPSKDHFGGRLLKGNPKGRRPLDSKLPTHLVLRSTASHLRLPKTFLKVNELVDSVCRKHGISTATFYQWKAKYGGLDVSEARRLKALTDENAKLKKLLAEAMLDNAMLKDLNSKKW